MMFNLFRSAYNNGCGCVEYWAFVRSKDDAQCPDYRPPPNPYQWVYHALWLMALISNLAGCAAGALTCNDVTLRQGEVCEIRPAFPTFPKGPR